MNKLVMHPLAILLLGVTAIILAAVAGATWTGEFKLAFTWKGQEKMITSPPQSFTIKIKNVKKVQKATQRL